MGAIKKIPIWRIDINPFSIHPLVKLFLKLELRPLRIRQAFVTWVRSGGTDIAGVGTIIFEDVETCLAEKVLKFFQVVQSPFAS